MSSEHITDEQILLAAEPFGAFQYGDAQGHKRIDFARAILALRPAAQPPKHKHWSAALADDMIASSDVPASQTWDVNQISMACAQAEISDGHCQSLLIALEESNKS